MWEEEKHQIVALMGSVLRNSVVVAMAIPSLMLRAGRSDPLIAYRAVMDLLLLPLLGFHGSRGGLDVKEFHLRLSHVRAQDKELLKIAKKTVQANFPKRGATSVDFVTEDEDVGIFLRMARFLAWAMSAS